MQAVSPHAGFTLIEVLVAISILTTVVFAPMAIIAERLVENALTERRVKAHLLAQEIIEYVRYDRDTAILSHHLWFSDIRSPDSTVNDYHSCFIPADDWISGDRDRYCTAECLDTVADSNPSSGTCDTTTVVSDIVTADFNGFMTGVANPGRIRGGETKTCDGYSPDPGGAFTATLTIVVSPDGNTTQYAVAVACVSWKDSNDIIHSAEHEEALFEWVTG